MASERQILANRRNAQKSTGPKTALGKKRSSKNAYDHGLSIPMRKVGKRKQLEELSRIFAGDALDAQILGLAEIAADAHADLERVRKVKNAILERAWAQRQNRAQANLLGSSAPLPDGEEEQTFAIAVQPTLPKLTKINRYEKRAANRRDRAIHQLTSMKIASKN